MPTNVPICSCLCSYCSFYYRDLGHVNEPIRGAPLPPLEGRFGPNPRLICVNEEELLQGIIEGRINNDDIVMVLEI